MRDPDGAVAFSVVGSNKVPFGVGGVILDKMVVKDRGGDAVCSVERRALAVKTAYDVYRDGKCVAKIERDVFSITRKSFLFIYFRYLCANFSPISSHPKKNKNKKNKSDLQIFLRIRRFAVAFLQGRWFIQLSVLLYIQSREVPLRVRVSFHDRNIR